MSFKPQHMVLFSIIACSSVLAEEALDTLIIEDTLNINPNVSQPEKLTRTEATSADGGDFLSQINGISISRFGGRGLEPIIRGQSQTRLNVLLDGAYIHGGCPNRMDPPSSWAALETYEEVNVLKGVQTLTKGGGGSGGTVSFERDTKALAEDKGIHGRVSAMVSDNHIKSDILADVVAASDKGYVRGIFQHKEADNYEDGDGKDVRSSFTHKQAGIIAGYTPTEDRLIEFSHEQNDFTDALYPGSAMDSPEETATITRLRYKDKPANDAIDEINAEVYVSDVDHVMDNYSLRPSPSIKMRTPTSSKTTGGKITLRTSTDKTQWEYGVDLQKNQRDAQLDNMTTGTAQTVSIMWPDVEIKQLGVFAEATHKLDQKRKIKAGLRIDQIQTSHNKANEKSDLMGGRTANQSYAYYYGNTADNAEESNVSGLLRYEQSLSDGLTLHTGISRTVRTADATERGINKWVADPASRWVGNPTIKPEKHHQIDAGLSKKTNKYTASATVFYDQVDDYILRDSANTQTGVLQNDQADIYRNINAELYGIEADAKTKLSENLDLSAALAYVHASNTTDDRPIAQTPPLNGKIQLDYEKNRWSAGSRIRFASAQNRIDETSKQEVGKTPGYAVLDVYGNYRLNKTLNLRYGVDNVLDKTYAEHSSRSNLLDNEAIKVNEPGRTAWLKLTAEF
jgi:iron complex outermembrane receptor protein